MTIKISEGRTSRASSRLVVDNTGHRKHILLLTSLMDHRYMVPCFLTIITTDLARLRPVCIAESRDTLQAFEAGK